MRREFDIHIKSPLGLKLFPAPLLLFTSLSSGDFLQPYRTGMKM